MKGKLNEIQLFRESVAALVHRPPSFRRLVLEVFETGNKSLLFVSVTMSFFGLILVYQGCMQALAIIPDLSLAGPVSIRSMIRVFGPLFTGLMVAFRVGAGIAAEAGTMVVTDQDGALLVSGSSPAAYLVAPRLLACIITVPMLTIVGTACGIAAGGWLGITRFDIPAPVFFKLNMVDSGDVVVAAVKSLLNGVAIPVIAACAGLKARSGSEGVGAATTDAVVRSAIAVIIIEFVVSAIARLGGI
jgi:phospholipid/cholesterol/gamma-HCH transport system permease protein